MGDNSLKRFKRIYIEITNVCNLNCDFCPQTGREPEFMSVDTFRRILDSIKIYTDYLYFHVKGEPLLHPHLDQFLDSSFEKGFKVQITTNGTQIQAVQNMLLMKPALRQINFSLHSLEGNDGMQGRDEYLGDIIRFIKEAESTSKIICSLRLWNLDENNTVNLERKRNNDLLVLLEKEFALPYRILEKVTPGSGVPLSERIFLNQDYQFLWPDLKEMEDDGTGYCYGLRSHAAILVDGTVVPCCLDGDGIINLGNIKEVAFSEIIESQRAVGIVDGFSRREAVEELCRKCGYRKRFG
jgi:MoaA/NifB/PqqE/SkfB family radical SAM enzyme